jgi:hypothetical protein
MEKGRMIARKQTETDALHKWRGAGRLPGSGNVDAYLKRVRG